MRLRGHWAAAALACALTCAPLAAAELSPAAQKEITLLLDKVGASSCSFNRNGTWYTGPEARKHLERKFDYMLNRGMLTSADQFIADAASASSMSGKPYLMKCGNDEPKRCGDWLQVELRRMRQPP